MFEKFIYSVFKEKTKERKLQAIILVTALYTLFMLHGEAYERPKKASEIGQKCFCILDKTSVMYVLPYEKHICLMKFDALCNIILCHVDDAKQ